MKKILISLALAFLGMANLYAVKAKPGITKLTLTDGTIISATLHGDEDFHYYSLLDGTPLGKDSHGKYILSTHEELQSRCLSAQARKMTRASQIGSSRPSYFPHVGSPKALVILAQFQDVKFISQKSTDAFNYFFNAKIGEKCSEFPTDEYHPFYGGVKQYFTDMSNGKFTPQFDLVGPVTLSHNSKYYGANQGGDDGKFGQMISEACQLVDNQVNFADYDSDGDGYVDLIYVIYAGYSESYSGNPEDCLWPKSGTQNFFQVNADGEQTNLQLQLDGKAICRYGISNELNGTQEDSEKYLEGIGLFCHEFSHTLGMPDLYVTNTNSPAAKLDNQSPEYWSLMDMGEYSYDGYIPSPYSAWESYIMGWSTPTTLSSNQPQQLTLEPYGTSYKSYKIETDDEAGEYLLLQSIQNKGWWMSLPDYGLLVWRIDYADKSNVQLNDNPNNKAGKPRVMVVPADGLLINSSNINEKYSSTEYLTSLENDLFPTYQSGSATKYEVNSLTEVRLNHSTLTTRPLYNIEKDEATGCVTFDYLKDFTTGIQPIITKQNERPVEYFDLEGKKILHPKKGRIYITNKKQKVAL